MSQRQGNAMSLLCFPNLRKKLPRAKLFAILSGEVICCKYDILLSLHTVTSCSRGICPFSGSEVDNGLCFLLIFTTIGYVTFSLNQLKNLLCGTFDPIRHI